MGNVLFASRLRPEGWRLVPGRVPIHLISLGWFSEQLQLLWAEFPRFQPAPSPACPDALPSRQPQALLPVVPVGDPGGSWPD